jgi:hypothetical protein
MKYKELKVVELLTNIKSNIGWNNFDANVKNGYKHMPGKNWNGMYVHLYFISDEEIKEGDAICNPNAKLISAAHCDNVQGWKKIEFTTNNSLTIDKSERTNYGNEETYNSYEHTRAQLPKIPETFESFYVKSKGTIDKVEINLNDLTILRFKKWSCGKETEWLKYEQTNN